MFDFIILYRVQHVITIELNTFLVTIVDDSAVN